MYWTWHQSQAVLSLFLQGDILVVCGVLTRRSVTLQYHLCVLWTAFFHILIFFSYRSIFIIKIQNYYQSVLFYCLQAEKSFYILWLLSQQHALLPLLSKYNHHFLPLWSCIRIISPPNGFVLLHNDAWDESLLFLVEIRPRQQQDNFWCCNEKPKLTKHHVVPRVASWTFIMLRWRARNIFAIYTRDEIRCELWPIIWKLMCRSEGPEAAETDGRRCNLHKGWMMSVFVTLQVVFISSFKAGGCSLTASSSASVKAVMFFSPNRTVHVDALFTSHCIWLANWFPWQLFPSYPLFCMSTYREWKSVRWIKTLIYFWLVLCTWT